jgi:hypothetical protein
MLSSFLGYMLLPPLSDIHKMITAMGNTWVPMCLLMILTHPVMLSFSLERSHFVLASEPIS